MTYRPDIDGLRAVAIVSVVLFHAKAPGFAGGFVGVDVFFVISGFLITSLLMKAVAEGRFSLLRFYDRRIRRIFPALMAVWCACMVAGAVLLLPHDFGVLGRSLTASAAFLSNIYFFRITDYFAGPAHEWPLLHTWSLSIEEQFYVVWPLLFVGVVSRLSARGRRLLLGIALITSLAAAEWQVREDATSAFFLPQYRAWELLLGCVLALELPQLRLGPRAAAAASFVGAAFVLQGVFLLDGKALFPGLSAVPPCLGTALIILGGAERQPLVNRVLATRPFVFVGLLSYSLYLWHWPALAYVTAWFGRAPGLGWTLGALAFAAFASFASWRWVETPFRRPGAPRRAVLVGTVSAGAFLVAGLAVGLSEELRWWIPDAVIELDRAARERNPLGDRCGQLPNANIRHDECRFGAKTAKALTIVVVGDSHGDHWVPAVADVAKQIGVAGRQVTQTGCPPLFDVDRVEDGRVRERCRPFEEVLERFLADHPSVEVVVLAARWDSYSETEPASGEEGMTIHLIDEETPEPSVAGSREVLARRLERTVRALTDRGLRVVLVGQVPALGRSTHGCVARRLSNGEDPRACGVPAEQALARLSFSDTLLSSLARTLEGVEAFLPASALCDDTICSPTIDGVHVYRDDDHINRTGSVALSKHLRPFIEKALSSRDEEP